MMNLSKRRSLRVALTLATLIIMAPAYHSSNADEKDRRKWDARYQGDGEFIFGKKPVAFLKENIDLLPKTGKALDIAMGEGRNGVFLATRGFDVLGIDISEKGLRKARQLALEFNTTIETKVVDLEKDPSLPANKFDLIVMTYYLQRNLFPQIRKALKPGGVILIETYNEDHTRYRPQFPGKYLLKKNELLEAFKDFKVLKHENHDDGKSSAYTTFLARK